MSEQEINELKNKIELLEAKVKVLELELALQKQQQIYIPYIPYNPPAYPSPWQPFWYVTATATDISGNITN